jgi:hypothetical protein
MPNFCPNCGSSLAKPERVMPNLCPQCGTDTTPLGANPHPKFCPTCGYPLGTWISQISPSIPRGRGGSDGAAWLTRIALLALVVIGLLFLLNNTNVGLVIKCHVLGDWGACLLGGQ